MGPTILPSKEIASKCYEYMFAYCTSLEIVPKMHTIYNKMAFYGMFQRCSKLESAKNIIFFAKKETPIMTHLFLGCTKLKDYPLVF